MKRKILFGIMLSVTTIISLAQNTRLSDENSIVWFNYFGTFKLIFNAVFNFDCSKQASK